MTASPLPPVQTRSILFISPTDVLANNGMLQRQIQVMRALAPRFAEGLDVLSLSSAPEVMDRWLRETEIPGRALKGLFPALSRWNFWLWYAGNVLLCNKLKVLSNFIFPVRIPLPSSVIAKYSMIVCYYPWGHVLLDLQRAGDKVVVDLGDVMGERHQRIGTRRWISLSAVTEKLILTSPSRCLAISCGDQLEFQQIYGVTLPVLPFVPPDHRRLGSIVAKMGTSVGYLAAPSYQNEEVIRILCSEEFLAELVRGGKVSLVLAGGICASIRAEERQRVLAHGGEILGRIDRIEDFYEKAAIVVNPVGPSTGTKIKSVEALFAGRHLLTTVFGVDSFMEKDFGPQISVVDWPLGAVELAQAIRGVLGSEKAFRCGVTGAESYTIRTDAAFARLLIP